MAKGRWRREGKGRGGESRKGTREKMGREKSREEKGCRAFPQFLCYNNLKH